MKPTILDPIWHNMAHNATLDFFPDVPYSCLPEFIIGHVTTNEPDVSDYSFHTENPRFS